MPHPCLRRLALGLAASLGLGASASAQDAGGVLRIREVGSYHVGGREVVLSGLPQQEISFTAGMAPLKVDPNGQPSWQSYFLRQGHDVRAGATVDRASLPDRGIAGNTYMLMMDRNSDQVAALVQDWMEKQGLVR